MPAAIIPDNEQQRLDALEELGILYIPLNERFDRITRTVCRMFDMPIAYVSMIDKDTQWFKSISGVDLESTDRSTSMCTHTLLVDEYIICDDLSKDERFNDSPFVTSGLCLRFYAGFTLKSKGQNIGTLCMTDTKPRTLSSTDISTMRDLVAWAQTEVNLTQLSELQIQLISELDQAQHDAKIDGLTELWNQAAIKEILQRVHQHHTITKNPYSIMMIDVDKFKTINDTHGHLFGDQVLKAIANDLKMSLRPSDAIGRYGGDEFIIILENCPYERAKALSQRVLQHNQQLIVINNNQKINCTISIGFASTDHVQVDDCEALLEHADQSLYEAKQNGRNCARG